MTTSGIQASLGAAELRSAAVAPVRPASPAAAPAFPRLVDPDRPQTRQEASGEALAARRAGTFQPKPQVDADAPQRQREQPSDNLGDRATARQAVAAFVVQSLAQEQAGSRPPPSAFLAGNAAYRRSAPQTQAEQAGVEILGGFPRLQSGRALDLSI